MNSLPRLFFSFFLGLLLQSAVMIQASAADLSGAYQGINQDRKKVDLYLHSLEDQNGEGSYLAMIVVESPLAVGIYLGRPVSEASEKLELVPFQTNPIDGAFGVNDPNATLIVEFGVTKNDIPILNAHSGNHFGIQDRMTLLPDERPDLEWQDLQSGLFRQVKGQSKLSIPDASSFQDGQTEVNLQLDADHSGPFILRNSPSYLFTLREETYRADFIGYAKYLTGVIVFVRHGSETDLLLIDPQSPEKVLKFKR